MDYKYLKEKIESYVANIPHEDDVLDAPEFEEETRELQELIGVYFEELKRGDRQAIDNYIYQIEPHYFDKLDSDIRIQHNFADLIYEKLMEVYESYRKTNLELFFYLLKRTKGSYIYDLSSNPLTEREFEQIVDDAGIFQYLKKLLAANPKIYTSAMDDYFWELFEDLFAKRFHTPHQIYEFGRWLVVAKQAGVFQKIKERELLLKLVAYFEKIVNDKGFAAFKKLIEEILVILEGNANIHERELDTVEVNETLANAELVEQIRLVRNVADPELIVDSLLVYGEDGAIDAYLEKWANYFEPVSKEYQGLLEAFWESKNVYAKKKIWQVVKENVDDLKRKEPILAIEKEILGSLKGKVSNLRDIAQFLLG